MGLEPGNFGLTRLYLTTTPKSLYFMPFPWNFRRQTPLKDNRAALTEKKTM